MPDQEPVDDELTRLRHLAFSRAGSAEDRARLAALESERRSAADTAGDPTETLAVRPEDGRLAVSDEADADVPADSAGPAQRPAFWSRLRVGLAAALGGLVAGLALAWAILVVASGDQTVIGSVATTVDDMQQPSSLEIFDREPTPEDEPASAEMLEGLTSHLDETETRLVGVAGPENWNVYAIRGVDDSGSVVCLFLMSDLAGGGGCTPLTEFRENGMTVDLNGVAARWGPIGDDLWVVAGFDGY